MKSLHRQLALGLAAGTVLLLVLLYMVVAGSLRGLAEEQIRSRLEHDAETLLTAIDVGPDGLRLDEMRINPVYRRPFSGHYYVVRGAATELRSRSLWDATLDVTEAPLARISDPRGEPLLAFTAHYTKRQQPLTITVAEELTALEAAIRTFQWRYAGLTALLLAALLGLQQLVLRRALRPLDVTRDELQRLGRGEITALGERGPREIAPLVTAFNDVVGSLRRRTERSQKALGNLAHALKAPLAVLGQLDGDPELSDRREVRETLATQIERLRFTVDRELRRARTVGFAVPGQSVDLGGTLDELISTLRQLYRERGLHFESLVADGLTVAIDRQDLLELFGNLLDNASKWADSRVTVGAEITTDGVCLTVDDDGPGVAVERRSDLLRRGQRLDEAVEGHGLGLAIANDTAALYGGRLTLGDSPLGGLRVTVTLPMAVAGG